MHEQAATMNDGDGGDDDSDLAATRPGKSPQDVALKFGHASGSRPLDGYVIKRGIGVGGFGQVYYATSDAGKEVALKHIQRHLDIELRGVTQCLNLKHPNLLALYDIKYDKAGAGWVIMEYVSGESLKDVIERNPNGMPVDQVNFWFRGITGGIACLHDHGIVHRDLKPGNLFSDEGIVKVGDYGLSKFISVSRRSGQTESVGTFHYMAPEIGQGRYGKEIDVYALGIILYEMLTGRVPFEGESSQEIIMKHLTAEPDLSGIQWPYRKVIGRALAKDPQQRFSSVDQMIRELGLTPGPASPPPAASAAGSAVFISDDEPTGAAETLDSTRTAAPLGLHDNEEMVFGPVEAVPVAKKVPPRVVAPVPRPVHRRRHRPREEELRTVLAGKTNHVRLTELTGSMLMGAFAAAVTSVLLMVLSGAALDGQLLTWAPLYLWLTLVGTAGTWAVLIPAKFWESRTDTASRQRSGAAGEQILRRFAMLVIGLVLAVGAYAAAEFLMIGFTDMTPEMRVSTGGTLPASMHAADGSPRLPAYLAVFAGLFPVLRWWRQADPLRRVRLGFWSTVVCVLWALVLNGILEFPHYWFVAVAATISVAVQLSAPWMNPSERAAARRQLEKA